MKKVSTAVAKRRKARLQGILKSVDLNLSDLHIKRAGLSPEFARSRRNIDLRISTARSQREQLEMSLRRISDREQ